MNYSKIFIFFFFITGCNAISPGMNYSPTNSGFVPAKEKSNSFYSQSSIDAQNLSYKNISVAMHNINEMLVQTMNGLNENSSSYEKLPDDIASLLRYEYKYVIGPGDRISFKMTELGDVDGAYIVNPEGLISVPYAGDLLIQDKTKDEAQKYINEILRKYYKNMKVVYWNNIPAPYMIDRFNYMAKNKSYDFEVWFNEQTEDGRDWKVNLKNVKFKYHFIPRINLYFFKIRLPIFIFTRKPDILITLYSEKVFYIGILLALLLRIKVCVHIVKTFDNWVKRTPTKEFFKKFLLSKIDFFETTGFDGQSYLKKYSKKKPLVFKHKFNVNIKHFDKTIKKRKKLRLYTNKKEIKFLYVGKIIKDKGLDILIQSVLKIKNNYKEYKDFSLLIVGNGKDKAYYLNLVKKFKINKIKFLSFTQKENLPLIFNASDVFVFPSLGDPYGIVVDEAMASKMPIISSHLVGEIKDRVINNYNGYIYKGKNVAQLTNSILKIMKNRKKIKIFGKRSRRLIKNNTPENYSNQFSNMINKIIKLN